MHPLRSRSQCRILIPVCVFLLTAVSSAASPAEPVGSKTDVKPEQPESQAELLALEAGDADVSLFMTGSWKGTFSGSGGLALTELGTHFTSEESPILFQQETDLTLELLIAKRWFVEASFLDNYDLNTYRAGYRGLEGETVQYVGVGNTGLDFPSFPYLDLGGDAPNSFGIYGKFGSGPLLIHTLFRYDAATRVEKVFVGTRERTTEDVSIENHLRGRSFVLPDEALDSAPVVYIEDSSGSFTGSDGRRYRRASASEYAASGIFGIVELTASPSGRVAVAYAKGGNTAPWTNSLGAYSPASGFLGEAQAAFSEADPSIHLADYPQSGGTGKPGTITLNGTSALIIYEKGTFSPFERGNRYTAPDSSTNATASVVRPSTGTVVGSYELTAVSDLAKLDFPTDGSMLTASRTVFELLPSRATTDRRSIEARWPLLAEAPEAYLSGSKTSSADIAIRFTTYGASGSYDIGKDVVPGSVQVIRNGFADPLAYYDEETGTVILASPASLDEIIRISFLKRADERRFGSVAAGLGVEYLPDGPISARGALGVRWNVSGDSYSEHGATNPGSVGLSGGVKWDYGDFRAGLTAGLTYDQPDTTGLYRVAGMEGSEVRLTIYDDKAFPSEPPESLDPLLAEDNAADLPFRDYHETDALGTSTLKPITWGGSSLVSDKDGPYAVSDDSVSGEILVAEFELDDEHTWAGFQARLGAEAAALERAKRIVIPYRFYNFTSNADFKVYAQFGALADPKEGRYETRALTYTALIYDSADPASGRTPGTAWKLAQLSLDDEGRRSLADARSMRIVIRFSTAPTQTASISGRLLVGGPTSIGSAFRPVIAAEGEAPAAAQDASSGVAVAEEIDASLRAAFASELDRLHPENADQRVLKIAWAGIASGSAAGADHRTEAIPLGSYRSLALFVRGPAATSASDAESLKESTLRIALARGPSSLSSQAAAKETPLEVRIPISAFTPNTWSPVEILYGGSESSVKVGGAVVPKASVSFRPSALAVSGGADPTYIAVLMEPQMGGTLSDGSLAIDELTLKEPSPSYGTKLGGNVAWKKAGPVLTAGDRVIVSDLETEGSFESNAYGDPFGNGSVNGGSVAGRSAAAATVLGSRLSGTLASSVGTFGTVWSASHAASIPVGPLSLQESFSFAPNDESLERGFGFELSLPLRVGISGAVDGESAQLIRTWKASLGVSGAPISGKKEEEASAKVSAGLDASAAWTENADERLADLTDYGEAWQWSWKPLTPDDGKGVRKRALEGRTNFALEAEPVGVGVTADGLSNYLASSGTTESTSSLRLEFPSVVGPVKGALGFSRFFSRVMEGSPIGVSDDLSLFASSLGASAQLWSAIPVNTLWEPRLEYDLLSAADGASQATFRDGIDLALEFPQVQGPAALVLPVAFQSAIERVLGRSYDTITDSIVTSGSLSFSAMNLFGAFGSVPTFSFYASDEFSHSIEAQAIFGDDASTTWQTTLRNNAAFYGFTDSRLGLSNTVVIASESWSEGVMVSWTSPAPKSFLGAVYWGIMRPLGSKHEMPAFAELAASPTIRERRETLEFSISDGTAFAWTCSLGHESIIRVAGRLTLNAFMKLIAADSEATDILAFTATIGTSLAVTY